MRNGLNYKLQNTNYKQIPNYNTQNYKKRGALRAICLQLRRFFRHGQTHFSSRFFAYLKEGKVTSKIEALRQAQLQLAGLDDLLDKNHPTVKRERARYSHPYYWGPFIMIGNWR